jgi:hypothetical protein
MKRKCTSRLSPDPACISIKHLLSKQGKSTHASEKKMIWQRLFRRAPFAARPQLRQASFRQVVRQYGWIALGTYSTLSFVTFSSCLAAIQVLGIDQKDVYKVVNYLKKSIGVHPSTPAQETKLDPKEPKKVVSYLPEWFNNPTVIKVTTVILLASAMTKLFTPIKIAITVAILPTVAKTLRRMGYIKDIQRKQ